MIDEKQPYPVVANGGRYIALVPKRFLRPLYVRLPDGKVFMQKFADGAWTDVSASTSVGLDIYDATPTDAKFVESPFGTRITSPPVKEQWKNSLLLSLYEAILMLPALSGEQGDVFVYRIDSTGMLLHAGRWGFSEAEMLTYGKTRVVTTDSENEIAGLWVQNR